MDYKDVRDLVPKINAPAEFQKFAGRCMSAHFGTWLAEMSIPGLPKRWDYVSSDHRIIGDAKYLAGEEDSRPAC